MHEPKERVVHCFSVVFPEIDETSIRTASVDSVEQWDSLRTVTLVSVLEEEFGVQIGMDDLDRLVSFDSVLDFLRRKGAIA